MTDQVEIDPEQIVSIAAGLAGTAADLRMVLGMLNGVDGEIAAGGLAARGAQGLVAGARTQIKSAAGELERLDGELRRRAALLRSIDETMANGGRPDVMKLVQEALKWGSPAGLSEELLKRIVERLGPRAEVYLPGVLISLLQGVEPSLDGNTVRLADQELAIVERMMAGQSKDDAVRDTLGLSGAGLPKVGRAAQDGQPMVFFVGGIKTNDSAAADDPTATSTWQNHEADLAQRADLAGVGYATFSWGSSQGLTDSLAFPSTTVPVSSAADSMNQELQIMAQSGASNIVLAGHSKGGALVMEYLCDVAEGRLPMVYDRNGRPLVVAASAMDSPLGGGPSAAVDAAVMPSTDPFLADFVGFERYRDGVDRIKNAAEKLQGQVDLRIYDNPDDVVSSPGVDGDTRTLTYPVDEGHPLDIERVHGEVLRDQVTRDNFWDFVEGHAPTAR